MEDVTEKEFVVSKTEITRRERAFATLLASLLIGLILALNKVIFEQPWLSVIGIFIFAFLLFIAFFLSVKFFDTFSKMKILLTEKSLQRISIQGFEEFLLNNVKIVEVKRTTRRTIREMKIIFIDNSSLFINGLENFEQFGRDILDNLDEGVVKKERKEFIDFDHPSFYMLLGLIISFFGVYLTKYLMTLDANAMNLVYIILFLYIFAVGIYFVAQKPISKRYGNKPKR